MMLRMERFYKPYSLRLLQFKHDVYKGTDVPKNFSSRLVLDRPATGEHRDVLIYMNNPLRYDGETDYQASFDQDDGGTILQVVHNPSWVTPYLACLQRESAFTDWLLFEAAAGLGDWGVLVRSPASLLALRSHLRSLLAAQLPGGPTIPFDWMDPVLLQAVLPLFDAAALGGLFGPVQALVIPGAEAWITLRADLGQLAVQRATPTPAA